jgi:hypothetical protein
MKAIATSVAIFTGVSSAAVGGAKLANTTVATSRMVNVSGAMRSRVWRMGQVGGLEDNARHMPRFPLIRNDGLHGFSYHLA